MAAQVSRSVEGAYAHAWLWVSGCDVQRIDGRQNGAITGPVNRGTPGSAAEAYAKRFDD